MSYAAERELLYDCVGGHTVMISNKWAKFLVIALILRNDEYQWSVGIAKSN